jgi:two-component system OmpR family response regulator
MKILGIDDNLDINELLSVALKGSGHEFSSVQSGKEGLEKLRQNSYDLVLLDMAMPEFSGIDVIDSLKRDGLMKKQKIVLFTASSITDEEMAELLKKGVSAFIKKPIEIDALLEKIDALSV